MMEINKHTNEIRLNRKKGHRKSSVDGYTTGTDMFPIENKIKSCINVIHVVGVA